MTRPLTRQTKSGFSRQDRECFSTALRLARGYALERSHAGVDIACRGRWKSAYGAFKVHFRLIAAAQQTPACSARCLLPRAELRTFLGLVFVTEARMGRLAVASLSKVLEPTREPLAVLLDKNASYRKVLNVLETMRAK